MKKQENHIDNINKTLDLFERILSYRNIFKNIFYTVNLKEINKYEKEIIGKFYNDRLSEYTLEPVTLKENECYDIILKLVERNILEEKTELERINDYNGYGVNYNLTTKARKKLNKKGGLI